MQEDTIGVKPKSHASALTSTPPASLPVMGILIWPSRISRLLNGQPVPSIELAAEAAKQIGVNLYFFRTRDVDLKARRIHGWKQRDDRTWYQAEMPWPDIFHPAIEIRKKKGRRIRDAMLKTARVINSNDILGKWEVHEALSKFPEIQPYLPETVLYKQPSDLRIMLTRHQSVLAKPRYGLGAMNISKVWNSDNNLYGWEDSSTGKSLTGLEFRQMLERVTGNANGPFIVQEELSILETEQQRNKIRVIMNKDGTGKWRHAVTYAYIGKADQFAVSRHQGAEQMTMHQGLKAMGVRGEAAESVIYQVAKVALLTVTYLDQVLGPMGEIGLDLAIGKNHNVWLIEANARPNKDNLPFENNRWLLLRPFLLMMQYARYLWQGGGHEDTPPPEQESEPFEETQDEREHEPQDEQTLHTPDKAPSRPAIAILFNRRFIRSFSQEPPEEAVGYMRAAETRNILAYFCSVDDINLGNQTIRGWSRNAAGRWEQASRPWPDYFYDQGKDMSKDERTEVDALRQELPKLATPINTIRFLDKWFLHRGLMRYTQLAPLLPDTGMCSHPRQLGAMLRRHRQVIVKPTNSSRGRGISLVTRTANRKFRVESYKGSAVQNLSLQQAFQEALKNANRDRVLLQQYLGLLEVNGRRFDLRMLMGKDSQGKWLVVSPRMRRGRKGSFVTNTNRGADRLPLLENLQKAVGYREAIRLYAKAERLAIEVCRYIERVVGPMGEIGLDFIVDKDLRFWFIEGNPQPGKSPMPHEAAEEVPLLYSHVMDYCRYLWEQKGQ